MEKVYVYNKNFKECKKQISLKNVKILFYKNENEYYCNVVIKNNEKIKKLNKKKFLRLGIQSKLKKIGINIDLNNNLDKYTFLCTVDNFKSKLFSKEDKKKKKKRKRKKGEDNEFERKKKKRKKINENKNVLDINDKNKVKDIKKIISSFNNPTFSLPLTLSLVFSEIFKQSIENLDNMLGSKKNFLDELQKIYPFMFI